MRLEELTAGTSLRGILPNAIVTVVNVQWHGSDACTLVYRTPEGRVADEILYRYDEPRLEIVESSTERRSLQLATAGSEQEKYEYAPVPPNVPGLALMGANSGICLVA